MSKYLGKIFSTNGGTNCVIVEYNNSKDLVVEFLDEHKYQLKASLTNLKSGRVKNPYSKIIYGVGYIGVGDYKPCYNGQETKEHSLWYSMMTRGYCPKFKAKHPTYKDCTVCETWHNFQVFAKWVKEHKFNLDGYQLDKDLLVKGNKKYSAKTCTLVPRAINMLLNNSAAIRGEFAQGVGWHKSRGKLRAYVKRRGKNIHLGYFETEEEASAAAKIGKELYVKEVALEWEGKIEDRLFNTLMSWKLT